MPTKQQLIKKYRKNKIIKSKTPALNNAPQRKGICLKVYKRNPKKPNSAKRSVANVFLFGKASSNKDLNKKGGRTKIIGYIPGEGHTLQEHSIVMIRGGRVKDLPGVRYHLMSGLYDFKNIKKRKQKRSKYGVKK